MNRFFGLFVVFAVVIALTEAGHNAEMMAAAEKCQASSKATAADMEALENHSPDMSKEAKCVMACVMQHFKMLSPDGKLQKDVIMKEAEDFAKGDAAKMAIAVEIYEACQSQGDPDICKAAFNYGKCMKEQLMAKNLSFDDM